jgi:hypothetical protein
VAAIAGTCCVRAILLNPAMAMRRSLTISPYFEVARGRLLLKNYSDRVDPEK